MEHRFGADFSGVRVHGGQSGAQLAAQHGARAFTVGHEIVFGKDELAPSTTSGRHLIAHELAHVRQQQLGRTTGSTAGTRATEADADRAAHDVVAGSHARVREAAPPSIQKQEPTFTGNTVAMYGRVAIVNDGGTVTGVLDAHPILTGTAKPSTTVRVAVYGNTVEYFVDEYELDVTWTADAPSFTKSAAPGWNFFLRHRIGELPEIIIDPIPFPVPPPPQKPKVPKKPPIQPPVKPKAKEPEPEVIPANFPVNKEEPKKPDRVAQLRASMLLGMDNLDQQLAEMSDAELTELGVGERKQLLDWLTDTTERTKSNQDSILRLLTTTPDTDARALVDVLRDDEALLTRKMLDGLDWKHRRSLHQAMQLLYNTTLWKGFSIEDLKVTPIIPLKPRTNLLDSIDLDQIDLKADGTIQINPKLDPFGRDQQKPLKLDLFGTAGIQMPGDPWSSKVKIAPGVNLFGIEDSRTFDLMPQADLPLGNLFPYMRPKLPIIGKPDVFTDFITGVQPSRPIEPLSPGGRSQLGIIKKEMGSWFPNGTLIINQFKAASPLDRQLLAENLGEDGMSALFGSLEPMAAVVIGSLGPVIEGRDKLTEKRVALMAEVTTWLPQQRTAIYLWMLDTMSNDDVRILLAKLGAERQLDKTVKAIEGIGPHLLKRGIHLDDYHEPEAWDEKGVGVAIGIGRWAKKAPGAFFRDPMTDELIASLRLQNIPEPYQTYIRNAANKDADAYATPGRIMRGGFGHLTFGASEVPFGLYSVGEEGLSGLKDIGQGKTAQGAEKMAGAVAMIVLLLVARKPSAAAAEGSLGAADLAALESEGLVIRKAPGKPGIPGATGLSAEATQVEAALSANPEVAAASAALVDELKGLANVQKAVEYMQGSSAATRLVIKRGVPGLKALVEAGGDVAAAEASLEAGPIVPKTLPTVKAPKTPPKPGMSTGEMAEQAGLDKGRPGSTLLPDKTAGYDGTKGSTMTITGQTTRTVLRNGVKVTETVVDITLEGGEAIQIKTVTGLGGGSTGALVLDNVKLAVDKAYKQANGELAIKASPQPLPGQPTVFPRTTIKNPTEITIIVQVGSEVSVAEMETARLASEAWVKASTKAAELPPVRVIVQHEP